MIPLGEKLLRIFPERLDPETVALQGTISRPFLSLTLIPGVLIFVRIILRRFCGLFVRIHESWEGGIET